MNIISFFINAVQLSAAFLFGATGETITEKAGHLNLGIPGTMCVGASCGCFAEAMYLNSVGGADAANPVLAILIPIICAFIGASVMGVIFSFITVTLHANQNVTGLVITTLGVGICKFMISKLDGSPFSAGSRFFSAYLPFAKGNGPVIELLFSYGICVYLAIGIAVASSIVLNKTRVGLHLRAVGENPATADAAGISVTRYRYLATIIGCGIAGLGGLCYIMDYLNGSWEYTIEAIGWLSVALVIFTMWRPNLAIIGSIIFGLLYITASYVTGISSSVKEIVKMLPYVVTIIVLIITSLFKNKNNQPPEALGIPYFREDR